MNEVEMSYSIIQELTTWKTVYDQGSFPWKGHGHGRSTINILSSQMLTEVTDLPMVVYTK